MTSTSYAPVFNGAPMLCAAPFDGAREAWAWRT